MEGMVVSFRGMCALFGVAIIPIQGKRSLKSREEFLARRPLTSKFRYLSTQIATTRPHEESRLLRSSGIMAPARLYFREYLFRFR